jgi:hypothetical protein
MMVRPWTQRIEARWRPEISFFEHRYEILRHLEAAKLLSAFRMLPSERISVRLGDAKHELLFGPDRIVLTLRAVDADTERLDVAAGLVIDAIKPRRSLRPQIDLQYLIPLDVAYAEARTTGLRRLVGDEPVGNGALVDWALTTDGVLENPAVRFNVEIGVVERDEIPPRLTRRVGRFDARAGELADESFWDDDTTLPAVAFFADGVWLPEERLPEGDTHAGLRRAWRTGVDEMARIVLELHDRVILGRDGSP